MFGRMFQRTWVSPVVALSFAAVGISGVLMLLEVRFTGMKTLHEWVGVTLVASGTVHLLLNWKALLGYLRNRSAIAALAAVAVLCLVLFFAVSGESPERRRPPVGPTGDNPTPAAQPASQQ
jgi:hypothetical protein